MKEKIIHLILLLVILFLNILFIPRAIKYSRIYPFQRIALGNVLYHPIGTTDKRLKHKSKIIEIENTKITYSNLPDVLESYAGTYKLKIKILHNGKEKKLIIKKNNINTNLISAFMLLILIANIFYIWALFVRIVQSHTSLARINFYVGTGIYFFFFLLLDLVSYNDFSYLFNVLIPVIAYFSLKLGFNFSTFRLSKKESVILITLILTYTIFTLFATSGKILGTKFITLLILLFICISFAIGKIVYNIVTGKSRYIAKRSIMIIFGAATGAILPIFIIISGYFYDMTFPIQYSILFSIAIPLFIGNGILQYKIFSSKNSVQIGLTLFFINLLIGTFVGYYIFFVSSFVIKSYDMILYYSIFTAVILLLLYMKRAIYNRFINILLIDRETYNMSLQTIAEQVSSPDALRAKFKRIFDEIIAMTNATSLKLALFSSEPNPRYSRMKRFIEYLSPDSEVFQHLRKVDGLIFKYTITRNSYQEKYLDTFLEDNNLFFIIPINNGNELKGALLVGEHKKDKYYSQADIKYLETVSLQIYQLLENDILFQEYIEKTNFERELDIASFIQFRLFPKKAPAKRGLSISFYNRPYIKVTGDYFDFIPLNKDRTAIVIGDISGHGLAAAMVLSMTSSMTNALLNEKKSIEITVSEINHFLNSRYRGIELITLFLGIYDKKTRELSYINAGHCPPIHIENKTRNITFLEGRTKILGADPVARYKPSKFTMKKNDEIIFYTDGLVEFYDEKKNTHFTEKNLIEIIERQINSDIEDKINTLVNKINTRDPEAIQDDITIIGVKIL